MAKSRIIKELANGNIDLATALKRTKVLIADLNCRDIMQWIDNEISGYDEDLKLPSYRITNGNLRGSYFKGSMVSHIKYTNVPLPIGKMPKEYSDAMLSVNISESIGALKELVLSTNSKNKTLVKELPADYFPYIAKCNNDPYMIISSAHVEFSVSFILDIFSKVENKLLDILLLLEKEFGILDELDLDVSTKSPEELSTITDKISVIVFDNSIKIGNGNVLKNSDIQSSRNIESDN